MNDNERRHLAAFFGDCGMASCNVCTPRRCTQEANDFCATSEEPFLGTCKCGYVFHNIPLSTDDAHDELCPFLNPQLVHDGGADFEGTLD